MNNWLEERRPGSKGNQEPKNELQSMFTYYSDGYTVKSNPSNSGGWVVTDFDGRILIHKILVDEKDEKTITNNEMELLGLLWAAMYAIPGSKIETDSRNNLAWINKPKSKARPDLMPIARSIKQLAELKNLTIIQKGRETNLAGIWIENNNLEIL